MGDDFLSALPHELTVAIVRRLLPIDVWRLARCNKTLCAVCFSDDVWMPLFARRFHSFSPMPQPDSSASDLFRRFVRHSSNFRRGTIQCLEIRESTRERSLLRLDAQEETVFCVACPPERNYVIAGGSVPHCSLSDLDTGAPSLRFRFASGLAMGVNASGVLCGGGFNGSVSIVWGVDDANPRRFLANQSVRYLKSQLALNRRGWGDVQEKSEMVDKLLSAVPEGTVPTFAPAVQFQASGNGLVDMLVEEELLMVGGWDTKVQVYRFKGKGVEPEKVSELTGHAQGVNCIRRKNPETLATAGSDGMVKFWDQTTNVCTATYAISANWVWCLDVRRDNIFYAAGVDQHVSCYDARAGIMSWQLPLPAEVSGFDSQPCNHLLATACFDGHVRLYDERHTARPLNSKRVSDERLTRCVLTYDRVVTGSFDGNVKVLSFRGI
jgi:WD40 repeat protein